MRLTRAGRPLAGDLRREPHAGADELHGEGRPLPLVRRAVRHLRVHARGYVSCAVQLHPMGVNSISFGSPHVRYMGVHRTCGGPNEFKKNTHPKNMTALFGEQVARRRGAERRWPRPWRTTSKTRTRTDGDTPRATPLVRGARTGVRDSGGAGWPHRPTPPPPPRRTTSKTLDTD